MRDLFVLTSTAFKYQFGRDAFITPSDAAREAILNHPNCPVENLAWAGICEIAFQKYYVGGTGPVDAVDTEVVVVEM